MTKKVGRHRLWTWCAAGLLVLLAGCSLTLTYRYADWIILWQVDHYFDLTADQRHDLTVRLTPLLARHRHEAIPQYEAFLVQVRQRFERGLTSQDIDWAYATFDRFRADLFDRVVADGGALLASVDSRQVRILEAALQKDHEKAARLVQDPAPERLKKRADATLGWLEDWLGSLSKDQEAQIREWSLALRDSRNSWLSSISPARPSASPGSYAPCSSIKTTPLPRPIKTPSARCALPSKLWLSPSISKSPPTSAATP
jgi:Family of unknown function (DUF6279)